MTTIIIRFIVGMLIGMLAGFIIFIAIKLVSHRINRKKRQDRLIERFEVLKDRIIYSTNTSDEEELYSDALNSVNTIIENKIFVDVKIVNEWINSIIDDLEIENIELKAKKINDHENYIHEIVKLLIEVSKENSLWLRMMLSKPGIVLVVLSKLPRIIKKSKKNIKKHNPLWEIIETNDRLHNNKFKMAV